MPQVFGVWAKGGLLIAQSETFAALLKEVEQLVQLQQGHDGIHDCREVPIRESDQRCLAHAHGRRLAALGHLLRWWGPFRMVKQYPYVRHLPESLFDEQLHLCPSKAY